MDCGSNGFGGSTDGRHPPRAPARSALTIRPLLQHFRRISDVPGVQLLMGTHAVHCTVHGTLSKISLRCPGPNGTSHSTPGPRCQRRQLRHHNQKHPDLTIRLFSRKPPHSCAPTSSRAPRLSRQTPGAHAPGFVVAMGSVTAPAPPPQQSQGPAATIRWRCCSPPAQSGTARHNRSHASGFRRMLGTLG